MFGLSIFYSVIAVIYYLSRGPKLTKDVPGPSNITMFAAQTTATMTELSLETTTTLFSPSSSQLSHVSSDSLQNESTELSTFMSPVKEVRRLCDFSDVSIESYILEFTYVNFSIPTYDGKTVINIKTLRACTSLSLHASPELKFQNVVIMALSTNASDQTATLIEKNKTIDDIIEVTFPLIISSGQWQLTLKYNGTLNAMGAVGTSPRSLSSNDRQSISDRHMVFPCWDVPAIKATFDIIIHHPEKSIALSNIGTPKIERGETSITTSYSTTSMMSPDSVIFFISQNINCSCEDEKCVHMLCSNFNFHKYNQISPYLEEMETIVNISYVTSAFNSLKVVVLEESPWSSNFHIIRCGFVIIRDNDDMIDLLVSYGITYQWFNCLVKPSSDSHLWLTYGLITYFRNKIDHPSEGRYQHDISEKLFMDSADAMSYEQDPKISSLISTSSLTNTSHLLQDQAAKMVLEYKAYYIIRITIRIVGKGNFHNAVSNYLKNNFRKSVSDADLIKELERISSNSTYVGDVIRNFLSAQGFATVYVTENDTNTMSIHQQHSTTTKNNNMTSDQRFWVPINFAISYRDFQDTAIIGWLKPEQSSYKISNLPVREFFVANKLRFGYYRVQYNEDQWHSNIELLKSAPYDMDEINRAQLVDDAFNFFEAGELSFEMIFNLTTYLSKEAELLPWVIAERHISRLFGELLESADGDNFKKYIKSIAKRVSKRAFSNVSDFRYDTYMPLLSFLCRLGLKPPPSLEIVVGSQENRRSDPERDRASLKMMLEMMSAYPMTYHLQVCDYNDTYASNVLSLMFQFIYISPNVFFRLMNSFIINKIRWYAPSTIREVLTEHLGTIQKMFKGHCDERLILDLVHILIENKEFPVIHLKRYFEVNEGRLLKYISLRDLRHYSRQESRLSTEELRKEFAKIYPN